ncbi:UNVERIFIED_CONTAM: hypothetical protein K2H54_004021 [Gekko kuhli]
MGQANPSVAMSDGLGRLTTTAGPSCSIATGSGRPSMAAVVSTDLVCAFVAVVAVQLCRGVVTSASRPRSSNAPSEACEFFRMGAGTLVSVSGACVGQMSALCATPASRVSAFAAISRALSRRCSDGSGDAASAINSQGPTQGP